ncbi:hypothetical protein DNL40_12520 [Xylanimonas oleitrophica]|uniref:Uncharacterized protein n=1 Tax=Xylanimonas oleitrophica TaxID=2607479 RepID=A0A2W5Y3B4_9MICO|nr:hypothetical protein [Xylanimonas oleitrophica]PZR52254.1 hypothetical protein DNL40_12520 [Xylanimonas oleitrophica]
MSENNPSTGRPLTRREIREREAAAAARAAGAAPAGHQAAGYAAPAQPPSRRTMHAPSQPSAPQAPVVRPPTASGGMRGLDETGRLTPVRSAPEGHVPSTPAPGAPTRMPSRQQAAPAAPSFGQQPAQRPASPWSTAAPASAPTRTQPPTGAAPAASRGADARAAAPTAFPPTTGSAPAAPSRQGGATPSWGAITGAPASGPAQPSAASPAQPPATAPRPGSLPPSRPQGSPFDSFVAPEQPVRAREAAQPDEDEYDEPSASYTWLHYIILVVVAFVLGLLLWKLLDNESPSFEPQSAPVSATTVHEHSGGLL